MLRWRSSHTSSARGSVSVNSCGYATLGWIVSGAAFRLMHPLPYGRGSVFIYWRSLLRLLTRIGAGPIYRTSATATTLLRRAGCSRELLYASCYGRPAVTSVLLRLK